MLAAIQIRGIRGARQDIKDTLFMLRLRKKNSCVVIPETVENKGMLVKAKDFITYGVVSDANLVEMVNSQLSKKKFDDVHVFFLNPPRGGFERKGIKVPFVSGGALGFRGDKMFELIKKMM